MNSSRLTEYLPELFSAALAKCGNQSEAEDLVQDTLLAALVRIRKDAKTNNHAEIENLKAYLFRTLFNKHNEMLRRKYGKSTICLDSMAELYYEDESLDEIIKNENAEMIRREVAYLGKIYREAVISYYFYGKSVSQIAAELNISEGTVKSRLSSGRLRIKKGVESMENYTEQSYQPMRMTISMTGKSGFNGQPISSVKNLVAENILIYAYEKPVTVMEIAKALGIPAAYIEPEVEKLVSCELMRKTGDGKVFTDMIVFTDEIRKRYLEDQLQFAEKYTEKFWGAIDDVFHALDKEVCVNASQYVKDKLHLYAVVDIMYFVMTISLKKFTEYVEISDYPERPDGGKWYATGNVYRENDDATYKDYEVYGSWSIPAQDYLGEKSIRLFLYDTSIGKTYLEYRKTPAYFEAGNFCRFLYAIAKRLSPEESKGYSFDSKMYENLPVLENLGIVKTTDTGKEIDIPVMSQEEYNRFRKLIEPAVDTLADKFGSEIAEFLQSKKYPVPEHIKSFLPTRQYFPSYEYITMAVIFRAIDLGLFNIDRSKPYPPMILVEDRN